MRIDPRSILAPIFWITATFLSITYGPVVLARIKGEIKPDEVKQRLIERSPEPIRAILGEQSESRSDGPSFLPPRTPPDLVKQVIEKTTQEIIEKSVSEIQETKQQTTSIVCKQIITEVQKQCGIGNE